MLKVMLLDKRVVLMKVIFALRWPEGIASVYVTCKALAHYFLFLELDETLCYNRNVIK